MRFARAEETMNMRPSTKKPSRPFAAVVVALATVTSLACFACTKTSEVVPPERVAERARASINPFKAKLKGELEAAMAQSPEAAVEVCSKRARELAREHSKDGVTVGRTAVRLRNHDNAPKPWQSDVMARLSKAPSGTPAFEVVSLESGRRGYAEAIWVGPQCLVCHGESVAPTIAEKLDAHYPSDQARGFKAGDFRGIFYAELER